VRLWNYADGTPEDALVELDFATLAGGWAGEDPVWAGDVDRMFLSMVRRAITARTRRWPRRRRAGRS
jgi:hypothetical protein